LDARKLQLDKIKFDCRHYIGYKPCGLSEYCEGCPHYAPQGKRILIIKLAAMGDVLRTTSLLPGLKKKFTTSSITWLTDKESIPLLKDNPLIDRLFACDAESPLILQSEAFGLLLNFEKEPRALALARGIHAEEKRGFAPSPFGTLSIFNPESLYALQLGLSDELKFNLNKKTYPEIIYEMSGIPYEGEEYVLPLSTRAARFASEFSKNHNLDRFDRVVGINTGCGSVFQTKQWTREGFAELIGALTSSGNIACLLLGGPREAEFNRQILKAVRSKAIDARCDNPLEDFIGIVSTCDLLVTSDSLAMHIAIGLKKKVVAFFGPTSPAEIDLFGRGEKILPDFPCLCCYKTTCPRELSCMQSLKTEVVLEAVLRQLGTPARKQKTSR
jgi:ADP-heptose:LPS heptosyltransferase